MLHFGKLLIRKVLSEHGVLTRDNHDEYCLPGRPKTAKGHPEELVSGGELGAGVMTFKNGELLSQGEIFNQQNPARAKQANENPTPQLQQAEHGLTS